MRDLLRYLKDWRVLAIGGGIVALLILAVVFQVLRLNRRGNSPANS